MPPVNSKIAYFQKAICFMSIILILATDSCQQRHEDASQIGADSLETISYQSVLDRYDKPQDSLKRNAAEFLIYNLSRHAAYYGDDIRRLSEVFKAIDTLAYHTDNVQDFVKNQILDSILKNNEGRLPAPGNEISDDKKVTPGFLYNNIEFAFKAWQTAPWRDSIAFSDFCEYILPYRVRNEQVEFWRPQTYMDNLIDIKNAPKPKELRSVFEYLKSNIESTTTLNSYFAHKYPFTQNFSNTLKARIGACETTTAFTISNLRSVGVPAALDYIPHWGNTNNKNHYVVKLIEKRVKKHQFSNVNAPINTWGIVDFSSDYSRDRHFFRDDEIPKGMRIQYIKTIPKIYRYTFSENVILKEINETVPEEFITQLFSKSNLKDVTDEYMQSSTIMVDIKPEYEKKQVAYLCVFDVDGWQPVAISRISSGRAFFDKVGNYVMYLPAVYDRGNIIPTGAPFFLDSLNLIHEVKQGPNNYRQTKLIRKAPLYSYTAYHTEALKGGRFEGANDKDFKDAFVLYQIENFPFYMNVIQVKQNKQFRYLRYVAPTGRKFEPDNIAEIQFFGSDTSQSLKGEFIGKKDGSWGNGIDKAFDHDLGTYYESTATNDVWIGIDLGKSERITTIKFCPRNDTNCILPGNEYELFFWNNKWQSLGRKKATTYNLEYDKVPDNALLWLKCRSGGREERIFTINKGMQQWW
jgi:hypothetical protein